jgi:hypothetical protein
MTYRIQGLAPEPFRPLFQMSDEELRTRRAVRVTADGPGFPCRVSLAEAREGEHLILVNHVSHDVETPFRASHAIYVREEAVEAPLYEDALPPMLDSRRISLRAFDGGGMLVDGAVAEPGEGDTAVRTLLGREDVAEIHAHTSAYGCFLAKIERS